MSDQPQGPGWWQARDNRWYPPELDPRPPPPVNFGRQRKSVPSPVVSRAEKVPVAAVVPSSAPKPRAKEDEPFAKAWKWCREWFRPRFRRLPTWAQVASVVAVIALIIVLVVTAPKNKNSAGLPTNSVPVVTIAPTPATVTTVPVITVPKPTTTVDKYKNDPASLLAKRDGSPDVAAYAAALDALQPHCREDRVTLAGFADFGLTDLEKNGIHDETRLTVLQHLLASIPSVVGATVCQGILAGYLVLRETP